MLRATKADLECFGDFSLAIGHLQGYRRSVRIARFVRGLKAKKPGALKWLETIRAIRHNKLVQ